VNQFQVVAEVECVEDLLGDSLETRHVEVDLLLCFAVELRVLVQVVPQQLSHDEQVLFVVEEVDQFEEVFTVKVVTVGVDVSEQLDLVD